VIAQVELQAGPFRVVSLMSREAADELGLEPGVVAVVHQVHPRRRRDPGGLNAPPCCSSLFDRCRSPWAPAARRTHRPPRRLLPLPRSGLGDGHRVRRSLADRHLHPARLSDKGTATTFAKNRLEIAVPKGNPGKITGLADAGDAGDAGKKIALCGEQVPCGAAAKKVFEAAKITGKPDSLEQDVKAALTKVSLGEVDAALVYKTDVQAAAGKVDGIEFPEADKAINDYPIATLAKAPNATGAKAFVDYVLSH
jgi:hypothetical protein